MDTKLIDINYIHEMKVGDYIVVDRSFMTQKYMDMPFDYHVEGILTEVDYHNNYFIVDNKIIDFSMKSVNTMISKKIDVIIID